MTLVKALPCFWPLTAKLWPLQGEEAQGLGGKAGRWAGCPKSPGAMSGGAGRARLRIGLLCHLRAGQCRTECTRGPCRPGPQVTQTAGRAHGHTGPDDTAVAEGEPAGQRPAAVSPCPASAHGDVSGRPRPARHNAELQGPRVARGPELGSGRGPGSSPSSTVLCAGIRKHTSCMACGSTEAMPHKSPAVPSHTHAHTHTHSWPVSLPAPSFWTETAEVTVRSSPQLALMLVRTHRLPDVRPPCGPPAQCPARVSPQLLPDPPHLGALLHAASGPGRTLPRLPFTPQSGSLGSALRPSEVAWLRHWLDGSPVSTSWATAPQRHGLPHAPHPRRPRPWPLCR